MRAIRWRLRLVAYSECVDERLFESRRVCTTRECALQRRMRRDAGRGVHRQVDVRPPRKRFTPPAHRTFCVQPLGLAEGADRFRMIERVIQAQSLIEVSLRPRVRRGDGVRMRAEICVERNRSRGRSWISLPRILENRQYTSDSDYA